MILFLAYLSYAQSNDSAQPFLPLQVGNIWNYRFAQPDTGLTRPFQVFDTTRVDNKLYYLFGDNDEYPFVVREDSLGRIWRRTGEEEVIWLDTTLDDGATYEVRFAFAERPFIVTVRRDLTVQTFAGTFHECIEFFFDEPESFDEESWLVLAPNVGLVRIQYGGFITQVLTSAIINGRVITKIDESFTSPDGFILKQNFPNPFNPTTEIQYQIPISTEVKLSIYNTRGQKIRTLIHTRQQAGVYKTQWDGKDDHGVVVSSGVYLYRLSAERFARTRKLLFIK